MAAVCFALACGERRSSDYGPCIPSERGLAHPCFYLASAALAQTQDPQIGEAF